MPTAFSVVILLGDSTSRRDAADWARFVGGNVATKLQRIEQEKYERDQHGRHYRSTCNRVLSQGVPSVMTMPALEYVGTYGGTYCSAG